MASILAADDSQPLSRIDPQGGGAPGALAGLGAATQEYHDRSFQTRALQIAPGGYFATGAQVMLVTLLGACVSACIRDPQRRIGGMNHFLLPHTAGQDKDAAARCGSVAMERLIDSLLELGARREALVAKVFGGANLLRLMRHGRMGSDNATFVVDYLERAGITILAADLGGVQPRRVHYFPQTGQVLLRVLPFTEVQNIDRAEAELEEQAARCDVENLS